MARSEASLGVSRRLESTLARRSLLSGSLLALVLAQTLQWLGLSVVALAFWLLVLGRFAPEVMRRVYRPRFWLLSIGLGLLSGLFIGEADFTVLGLSFSSQGLEAGGWMIVRGLMLLTVASLVATTLTRRQVIERMARLGFAQASQTIQAAVEMLPQAQDGLIRSWRQRQPLGYRFWRLPRLLDGCFRGLVVEAARLAESRAAGERRSPSGSGAESIEAP